MVLSHNFLAFLLLGILNRPLAHSMTDYSQLNHDEPTHWTKAATTHTAATERAWKEEEERHVSEESEVVAGLSRSNESSGVERVAPPNWLRLFPPKQRLSTKPQTTESQVSSSSPHTIISPNFDTETDVLVHKSPDGGHYFDDFLDNSMEKGDSMTTSDYYTDRYNSFPEHIANPRSDAYYRYDEDRSEVNRERGDINNKSPQSEEPPDKTLVIPQIGGKESGRRDYPTKPKLTSIYDALVIPTIFNSEESYDPDSSFKKWDQDSEEQEKLLEGIVFQANNETMEKLNIETSMKNQEGSSRWFLLLLAGNSTIVQLRQKDFAKYLKLNLAARLSLEYDEVKVNKVVLAPPRLMVNVSVIPSASANFDEEFDLNEKLFGEEEAPLHKLAETNATFLELSGEEYHVVRFLSLRSQQPVSLEEVASETSVVITDKHMDIERVIYIGVGGACAIFIIPLLISFFRAYVFPKKIKWPWNCEKAFFPTLWTLPRHQRMNEATAPGPGGPLTVIYSGNFVDRNGPPSGSWIDDNYQTPPNTLHDEPSIDNPLYGFGALNRTTMQDICNPSILESPRYNIDSKLHILGCRPNHLLLPHTPVKRCEGKHHLNIHQGLDNPNYQT